VKLTTFILFAGAFSVFAAPSETQKPLITLDEFFDQTSIDDIHISPDGRAVVVEAERPDWEGNKFLHDLWMWTPNGTLFQLTRGGVDHNAQWSPDGRWIAFLAERPRDKDKDKDKAPPEVWVIPASGGEAFPVTSGDEGVHAFSWSGDSQSIFFATRLPWTKEQDEAYKKDWNDVTRLRESERPDVIYSTAFAKPAPKALATVEYRVTQMRTSPDGKTLAFAMDSIAERAESVDPWRLSVIDLPAGKPRLLSHSNAIYENLQWTSDSARVLFQVVSGSLEGPYRDVQPRLYSADAASGKILRWAEKYTGAITGYSATSQGGVLFSGMSGTEAHVYSSSGPDFSPVPGWAGTYAHISAASGSAQVALVFSSMQKPTEAFLADDPAGLEKAQAITSFSRLFTERALPQGKAYRWKSEDGTTIEGMLVYPPGQFEAKHLRMFTFIHGGPGDADGDKFGADWYDWAILAASKGWLVFRPNYRGSTGYGDQFALDYAPRLVSLPGKDIMAGVDALVKDGIADPDHLTIGGYSYGGYMTNWLITQTTRFKAAVSGAGAVEHTAGWGNDDEPLDDAFAVGGAPWEAKDRYNEEAALWQLNKVKTPTHVVAGGEDIRVPFQESYLLERALHTLGVPTSLLVFPGEGHPLSKNPWHGKIKVREEIKWLEKYGL
jgi:dipeptidyl aminopeptidase/acylaminoacyl peptidase